MIFDSEEMAKLREKYKDEPDFRVPKIVFLDRTEAFSSERGLLEKLVESIDPAKRKGLFKRFLSIDDSQHVGAWFEILLYGWLKKFFETEYEPEIEGNYPDFQISTGYQNVILEAHVIQIGSDLKNDLKITSELFYALKQIQLPYIVHIKEHNLKGSPNMGDFVDKTKIWLRTEPTKQFEYQFEDGATVILEAEYLKGAGHVTSVGPSKFFSVSPDPLKNPIGKKAKQHPAIRKAGLPYVIALLIESPTIDAEDIVNAWFGNLQIVFDPNTNKVVRQKFDLSGLHYYGKNIFHKTVSGTLVFKAHLTELGHMFRVSYIENPYASVPISPSLFLAKKKWVVISKSKENIEMGWEES